MEEEIKNEEIKDEEIKKEAGKEIKKESPKLEAAQEEKPLDKMTVIELRAMAREIPGVTGVTAMKKEELLSRIKEYRGIEDEGPKKKKKSVAVEGLSVTDLKKKIAVLRVHKEAAYKEKDRKKVTMLRRRINRLKKRTRKAI
jgi:hypothetical protein